MENKKILVTLTTTPGSNWREKIKEVSAYNIREIALFLTGLGLSERKKLYALLEKSPIKSVPHVHLRTDMDVDELDYLSEKYNTQVFNLHPEKDFPIIYDYSKYFSKIYIENLPKIIPTNEELEKFAGLCIDFSHWECPSLFNADYKDFEDKAVKYKVGCCHISAVKIFFGIWKYDSHRMSKLKELDYIKKYVKYLPDLISIELENSLKEQLKVRKYLEKIINDE
ncbi:hypothetical protein J7J13_00335 [bacterium]|nr:hypothetical protein [bacterium]